MGAHQRHDLRDSNVQVRDLELIPTFLRGIPSHEIETVWPDVNQLLGKGCARTRGRRSLGGLKARLLTGEMQLWIAVDRKTGELEGVCVTEIVTYQDTGLKACFIALVTGRERERWLPYGDVIEAWAKSLNCSRIEAWARPGWERDFPNYKRTLVLLEKDL